MTAEFAPSPGAAPWAAMVWAQARMEVRMLARNGEQVLLAVVIPLLLLVGGARSGHTVDLGPGRRIDVLTPGVFALAVLSTSFTSLAIATGFERRYGVLKRLGATPLPRSGLLAGKAAALVFVELVQLLLVAGTAAILGWHPHPGAVAVIGAALLVVAGTAAFAALGMLLAGTLRAEATLAAANLAYVVLLVAGAVVVPAGSYPAAMRPVIDVLPSGALADGLRQSLNGSGSPGWQLLVLAGWAVVAGAVTARVFRWE